MSVNLAGALPKASTNGLGRIAGALIDNPDQVQIAIVLLDSPKMTTNNDTGEVIPTARVRAIEPLVTTESATTAREMMRVAYQARTGNVELPLDWEGGE